jgi:PRTRC genetic system protein A
MPLDPRDAALQSARPVIAAPRFGTLPEMQNGQRLVVAANGVSVQVKLDWLDCTVRIADIGPVPPLPYGILDERIVFAFNVIPVRLLDAFVEVGRRRLPDEIAGGLIYSRQTGELRLQLYEALTASPGSIRYAMPALEPDESIAVDLHTHGRFPAFWSPTDDRDDQGIKIAGVFGDLHQPRPSAAFRLAVNGCYRALQHPWQQAQTADDSVDSRRGWSILKRLLARGSTWST